MSKNWNGQRTTLGNMPFCHATRHTSPAEALTAFGYFTMEFYGRRLPTLIYIYGSLLKLLCLTLNFNPLPSTKQGLNVDGSLVAAREDCV